MKAIITVVGKDRVGIIANVSNLLYENKINILDITQTIMGSMFTMIMLVDFENSCCDVKALSEKMDKIAKELNLSIHVQREELFNSMHRI